METAVLAWVGALKWERFHFKSRLWNVCALEQVALCNWVIEYKWGLRGVAEGRKEWGCAGNMTPPQTKATPTSPHHISASQRAESFVPSKKRLKLSFLVSEAQVLGFIFWTSSCFIILTCLFMSSLIRDGCLHSCTSKSYQSFRTSSNATFSSPQNPSSFSFIKHLFIFIFLLDYVN